MNIRREPTGLSSVARWLARVAVSASVATIAAWLLTYSPPAPAGAQPVSAPGRKVFKDSVTPIVVDKGIAAHGLIVQAQGPQHKNDKMPILFSLEIPAEATAKLEAKVAKGEVVTPKELESDYSASPEAVERLVGWLKAEGFEITSITPDRTSIYAQATVGQIEKSLKVQMVRVTSEGRTYNAARNAPSLPADVGSSVHAIIGLQPFRHAHKFDRARAPLDGNRASSHLAANVANTPPYLVSEIRKAYNADNLPVSGAGEKIAILIDTFPEDKDLQAFWSRNSPPSALAHVEKINVPGGVLPRQEGEETLDVEWATGLAPGAIVRIYASGSLEFVALDKALDRIIADLANEPTLRQMSISLGLGEAYMGGPEGEIRTQHQKFLKLAAAGVNVFVSSGDAGSNPDEAGQRSGGADPTTEYESSDSAVIGVGGTTLTLDVGTGRVAGEQGWPGSGGGESIFFNRPTWQTGLGVPGGTARLVPDVSLAADPERGALLIFGGNVVQIGGTSWSAPAWAAFCALINEARNKSAKAPLPFLNPLIYPLIGTASFRDITEGSNGAFSAGPGYDRVTGIGVPNVRSLIDRFSH